MRDLLENHLEPGYQVAAARRSERPISPRARRLGAGTRVLVLLAIGVLLAVAYAQATARAPQAARTRAALADDVRARAALTDRLQRQATALRRKLNEEQARALTSSAAGAQAVRRLTDLDGATALVPVRGAGLIVTVGNAGGTPDPLTGVRPQNDPTTAGQIQDRDLAAIVNALWASGAEAISVGGQRLSPTSTIRSAGGAILVDFRPVSSPYQIRVIGDAGRMQPRFADSKAARSLTDFVQLYGITFKISRAGHLELPAAPATTLKYAVPSGPVR